MKILLFTNSEDIIRTFKSFDHPENGVIVEVMTYSKLKSISMTDPNDIYVIDDDCFDCLDAAYLDILKEVGADILLFVSDLKRLQLYMKYNIFEYYCNQLSLVRISSSIKRLKAKRDRKKYIQDTLHHKTLVAKTKSEVLLINYDDIYYLTRELTGVKVVTEKRIFILENDFVHLLKIINGPLFQVDRDMIVNFSKVQDIKKLDSGYQLKFRSHIKDVCIGDYIFNNRTFTTTKQNYIIKIIGDIT